jgi:hypothetical protein
MFMLANVVIRAFMNSIKIKGFCFVITALAVLAEPINAQSNGQESGQFKVTVNLQSANSTTGPCINGSMVSVFGANVTMTCTTGLVTSISAIERDYPSMPMNSGAYRFIYLANVESLGAIDVQAKMNSYNPAGSVTTWRLAHLPYLDYVEMQIGW